MTNLLREVKDSVAVLTLHRPEKLNALNYALIDALDAALDELEADPTVRAVILTGSGDHAFSAGADIAEFAGSVESGVERALRDFVRRGQRLTRQIEGYTKPLIAAVNGIAFGAGLEITEAAPLALARVGHRGHAVCLDGPDARHPPGHRLFFVSAQMSLGVRPVR